MNRTPLEDAHECLIVFYGFGSTRFISLVDQSCSFFLMVEISVWRVARLARALDWKFERQFDSRFPVIFVSITDLYCKY